MQARRTMRLAGALAAAGLLAGCGGAPAATEPAGGAALAAPADAPVVVVHKTESCECCGVYEGYLEDLGHEVETVIHEDIAAVKVAFGIPEGEGSCHTNEVDGYAVEGHVPSEAILQLLAERPDVDGISLAGMPLGSPGMPGEQTEPFVVHTFVDGEVVGELGRY